LTGGVTALLEREFELGRLDGLVDDARAGHGHVVFVAGEAGIGKSALITELARRADDVRIVTGRCDALSTPRALGPFLDIADQMGLDQSLDRNRLLDATLSRLRQGQPTIIIVEDAHWADDASIELLGMIGRRVADLPLLLLVTYRDDEATAGPLRQAVGDLVTASSTIYIGLRPLSIAAIGQLAAGRGVSVDDLHARSGGNPFYVTEVLASTDDDLPTTIRLAVLARAARLDGNARLVLDAIAIVPGQAERWLIDALCQPDPAALAACVSAGMLVDHGGTLGFRHELARLALWSEMPEHRRRHLHALALASLVERASADPERIVHHAVAAGDDDAIAHWATAACSAAAVRSAHPEAIRHGELALQSADGHLTGDQIAGVWSTLAHSYLMVARPEEAERAARTAVEHWTAQMSAGRRADALIALASAVAELGRMRESMSIVEDAIHVLGTLPPGASLANALIMMTTLHMLAREREAAHTFGIRAIALAEQCADPDLMGRAHIATGTADVMDGRFDGIAQVQRGIDLGRTHELPLVVSSGLRQLGSGCGEMKRYDVAVPALEAGITFSADHLLETNRRYQQAWLARCRFDLGQWDDVGDLVRSATGGRSTLITRFVALNTLGWLRARRGEADIWPALDEAHDIARRIGHLQRLWPNAVARAEAGWLAGDLAAHVPMLQQVMADAVDRAHGVAIGEMGIWLQRAGALDGVPPLAAEPYRAWIEGDLPAAAAAFRRLGCPYETAMVLVETNDTTSLREAWATFERLGAVPMARVVATSLDRHGITVARKHPSGAQAARPSGLSDREIEVLRLVAAGFSNPQIAARLFISRKTAEHHVSNILAKLGTTGRAEAAVTATRLGILGE
jgi:DNA-binding CsgD family transcriptional regulator/tetratricopeptide (TPR) repeat protein